MLLECSQAGAGTCCVACDGSFRHAIACQFARGESELCLHGARASLQQKRRSRMRCRERESWDVARGECERHRGHTFDQRPHRLEPLDPRPTHTRCAHMDDRAPWCRGLRVARGAYGSAARAAARAPCVRVVDSCGDRARTVVPTWHIPRTKQRIVRIITVKLAHTHTLAYVTRRSAARYGILRRLGH